MRNFTAQEWQILKADLSRQSDEFKERLAYILDGEAGESANEIVQILKIRIEMKLDIEGLKHEFESELNTQDWFKNVGKQPADADQVFAPFCVKFADFKRLSKLLKSNEWCDIDLDTFAEICRFSDQILRQYSLMDELACAVREILSPKKELLTQKILSRGLPIETYDYSVLPIVLRAFQEFGVRKFCPNFRIDFNMNLLKILNLGYLPCGWKTNAQKLRQDYNPIAFVGDSVKRQNNAAKFSYDDGELYVY